MHICLAKCRDCQEEDRGHLIFADNITMVISADRYKTSLFCSNKPADEILNCFQERAVNQEDGAQSAAADAENTL